MYTQVNYCSSSIVISLISSIKYVQSKCGMCSFILLQLIVHTRYKIRTPDQRGLKCSLLVYNKRVLQKTEFFERYKFADLSMNIYRKSFSLIIKATAMMRYIKQHFQHQDTKYILSIIN